MRSVLYLAGPASLPFSTSTTLVLAPPVFPSRYLAGHRFLFCSTSTTSVPFHYHHHFSTLPPLLQYLPYFNTCTTSIFTTLPRWARAIVLQYLYHTTMRVRYLTGRASLPFMTSTISVLYHGTSLGTGPRPALPRQAAVRSCPQTQDNGCQPRPDAARRRGYGIWRRHQRRPSTRQYLQGWTRVVVVAWGTNG